MQPFIRANDATEYVAVIAADDQAAANVELVDLQMCCKKAKESRTSTPCSSSPTPRASSSACSRNSSRRPTWTASRTWPRGVTRRGHARDRQDPLQLHRQLRAAHDMSGAPRPASGHIHAAQPTSSCSTSFLLDIAKSRCSSRTTAAGGKASSTCARDDTHVYFMDF